ncbi:MAG: hypothetical protein Q3999_08585, partial [Buchananella hordeovulneris]|nr:hypothetical protein [Buchananella hordeovulneris]
LVKPYEEDRWDAPSTCVLISLALAAVAAVLYGRRELVTGWLAQCRTTYERLRIRGVAGLIARLGRAQAIAWLVAGVSLAGQLGSITGSLEEVLEGSAATMEWMGKMTASQDLVVQSLAMLSVLLAMLALATGVQRASVLALAEREGWLETTLAQGARRSALYWGALPQRSVGLRRGAAGLGGHAGCRDGHAAHGAPRCS